MRFVVDAISDIFISVCLLGVMLAIFTDVWEAVGDRIRYGKQVRPNEVRNDQGRKET